MSTGHFANGHRFEDLFDPDVQGDGPSVPGMQANGQPLRFAHVKYGQRRGNVGHMVNGADVASLWAAKGTAIYDAVSLPLVGLSSTSGPPVSNAHCAVFYMPNGDVETYVNNPQAQKVVIGRWITSGNPLNYEFRFTKESGDDPTNGQFGVWLPASNAPGLGFDLFSPGYRSLGFTAEVRRIGTGVPNATRTGNSFALHYSNESGGIAV